MAAIDDLFVFLKHKISFFLMLMDDLFVSKIRKVQDYIVAAAAVCCIIFLIAISVVTYHSENPSLYIQDLYVPALNKTTTFNTSVFIDVKFERAAAVTSPSYAYFQMTLFYGGDWRLPVANHVVEGFSMGGRKKFHVEAAVEAPGVPWEEATRAVSGGSEVAFVVELVVVSSSERCEIFRSKCRSEEEAEFLAARVAVDASGHKVSKKPIEFRHIDRAFVLE